MPGMGMPMGGGRMVVMGPGGYPGLGVPVGVGPGIPIGMRPGIPIGMVGGGIPIGIGGPGLGGPIRVVIGPGSDSTVASVSSGASRQERLKSNHMYLYHQTSREAANEIIRRDRFYRGTGGAAGGGIYFATTKEATHAKAHSRGVILRAKVRLGRVLHASPGEYRDMTFTKLQSMGYDSIRIDGFARGPGTAEGRVEASQIGRAHV